MNLEHFKTLIKEENKQLIKENRDAINYTRVSSKDQHDKNNSLENQAFEVEDYAKKNGYNIVAEYGNTYESAKSDTERKEFQRMINELKASKKRPSVLLVFKMSRFSRTGLSAISLVNDLVEKLGINIIEVSTGKNTFTDRGKTEIIEALNHACRENLERLEITVPGMKRFLKKGNWLGVVPLGYDHYGPRVKDITKLSPIQKITINSTGEQLKKAWEWKTQGMRDFEIMQKLASLGVYVSKQKLSQIWRRPFYAGVIINELIKEPIAGNWEPLVSREDFFKVQAILDNNNFGHQQAELENDRPLQKFIICNNCDSLMTGYKAKGKHHYYKCSGNCKGYDMNACSTKRSVKKGLNDLFIKHLQKYEIKEAEIFAFKEQMKMTISKLQEERVDNKKVWNKRLNEIKQQRENLEKKYALENMRADIFEKFDSQLKTEMDELEAKLADSGLNTSNLDKDIEICADIVRNISKYYTSMGIEMKHRIQKLVFPEGVVISSPNRVYRTKKLNEVFCKVQEIAKDSEGTKEKTSEKSEVSSSGVAGKDNKSNLENDFIRVLEFARFFKTNSI